MSEIDCPLGSHPKLWDFDDITACARVLYFDTYWPALLLTASVIVLTLKGLYNYTKLSSAKGSYSDLKETEPLLAAASSSNATSVLAQDAGYTELVHSAHYTEEVKKRHFDTASLPPTKLNGEPHGRKVYVPRNALEKFRVVIEECLILLQIVGYAYSYKSTDDESYRSSMLVNIALWGWLLLLTTLRVANLNDTYKTMLKVVPNLWVNNFVIYLFLWFSKILVFRSSLLGNTGAFKGHYELEFALLSIVFADLLTSGIGYRCQYIYVSDENRRPSPEPNVSILRFVTFSWIDPMIWHAFKNVLKTTEVWDLGMYDFSYIVIKSYKSFSTGKKIKFKYRLMLYFLPFTLLQCFWAIAESIILFTPAILLKRILEFVEDRESGTLALAWFYIFAMFASKIFSVISSGQALYIGRRVCIRLKSVVISEIYGKALRKRVSNSAKASDKADAGIEGSEEADKKDDEDKKEEDEEDENKSANLGAIINLMAVDAFKISEVSAYLHALVACFFEVLIAVYLLYGLLGWSAIVGAFSVLLLSPVNYRLIEKMGTLQRTMLGVTDRRIQKLNETLQSIRIIKFFAWEDKFKEQILKIRNEELGYLKKRFITWTLVACVWFIAPTLITLVSFSCYIFIAGEKLTTPVAFTALSLFNLLRNPLDQLSDMISFVSQSMVSLNRVQDFLDEDETTKYEQLTAIKNTGQIGFKNANLSWDSTSETDFKLRNLNVDFKVGKLNVIIGPTGSGKTSLLMALLGEMELLNGEVYLPGYLPKEDVEVGPDGLTESVAYCSQAAWLLNATIKENILFGSPYHKERYNNVVKACGLSRDFEILKAGDQTEIGEKGIALSGGQKQRVSLARALYSNSRHVLLDDCLSAVDSHTALHIYDNCISGPLMENRTVLLVSHNVALTIKDAAFVVVMDNGKITHQGAPDKLYDAGALGDDEMIKSSIMSSRAASSVNLKSKGEKLSAQALKDKITAAIENDTNTEPTVQEEEELEALKDGKLIEEETKSDGVVSGAVYKWFFDMTGGVPVVIGLVILFTIAQFIFIGQSWWVRAWASNMDKQRIGAMASFVENSAFGHGLHQFVGKPVEALSLRFYEYKAEFEALRVTDPSIYYICIYGLFGIVYAIVSGLRIIYVFLLGLRAAKRIFKRVLHKVLRAKLRFFDSTPIGRIMNRLSKDIESVDQDLTPTLDGAFSCVVSVLAILVLICFITPGFIFFAFLILCLYYAIATFYLGSSRELKRFDSVTKSPIHQHFSETLVGVSTIRAYGVERRFMQENINKIDENNRPFYYMWVSNRWLSVRNDLVGALVVFFSGCFVLWSIDSLDAGLAGISLSYAISFNESALWVVRLYANVEMNMNSVERLKEYMDIEEEPAEFVPENEPPASWPEHGKLEVNDVSLRYAPHLPRVIKNVTFDVEPTNKIGIVGRTGAGKSTIITALFRFLDPETGYIKIDGVDITSIGLTTLRKAITIIPQDPTLFTGSIKSNLDPFDQYTDEQIFEALKRVNLITSDEILAQAQGISPTESDDENVNKFLNLNNEVSEGGGNLSQGQRQLMCLARSLLRAPKIMLLDEATASIDYDSDAKIQQTIRQEFAHATILTIAHRLRSIIDYDKILVMDAGEVVEYDHPYKLLTDKNSKFYGMCVDSGELDVLIQMAKEAYLLQVNK